MYTWYKINLTILNYEIENSILDFLFLQLFINLGASTDFGTSFAAYTLDWTLFVASF